MKKLINIQYERNEIALAPGRFRVKGDTIDIIPGYYDNIIRIELFGDEIERIVEINRVTGDLIDEMKYNHIYPTRHFVIPEVKLKSALESIKQELDERLPQLDIMEAHRLKQRTLYDIEMMEEFLFLGALVGLPYIFGFYLGEFNLSPFVSMFLFSFSAGTLFYCLIMLTEMVYMTHRADINPVFVITIVILYPFQH